MHVCMQDTAWSWIWSCLLNVIEKFDVEFCTISLSIFWLLPMNIAQKQNRSKSFCITWANCRLFPDCVYRTVWVLQSCSYFIEQSMTIITITFHWADSRNEENRLYIDYIHYNYFISFNVSFFSGQNKKKRKKLAWLVVDSWLKVDLGSRLAHATLQL